MAEQVFSEKDSYNSIITEIGVRISELEEKQRLLKDRLLLIGNNLISFKEEYESQLLELKNSVKTIESDVKSIKQMNQRIISELSNSARKSELEILKRQAKIFQPLEFIRQSEIRKIIKEELSNLNKKKGDK